MSDTTSATFVLDPPRRGPLGDRLRHLVADDRAWLGAAVATALLMGWNGDEASSLAWMNPILLAVPLAIRWHDVRRGPARVHLGRRAAVVALLVTGWAFGMLVELTLAAGGDGFGGMHPDTGPSFVIAQGYYLPAAVFTWLAIRRWGLDVRRAFWFAGAMAWWEALTVGAMAMLSPALPLAPILAAYYVSTYALCGMSGLLVIDHRALHGARPRPISTRRLVGAGVAAGTASWLVFVAWAEAASRLFGFAL